MTAPSTTEAPEGVRDSSESGDDLAHIYCAICYPVAPGPGVGRCGTPGWIQGIPVTVALPNECQDCQVLLYQPCSVCTR